MKSVEIEEKASLYAVGALDKKDAEIFEKEWENYSKRNPESAEEFGTVRDIMPLISSAVSATKTPSASVKENLMKRLKPKPVAQIRSLPDGFKIHYETDRQWTPFIDTPEIQYMNLSVNAQRGYVTSLVKLNAGAVLPEHDHLTAEECYVLSGDLIAFGRKLGAGDFLHADSGTHHEPLRSENGCIALLIYDPVDLLPSKIKKNRILKPILERIFS